MNAGKSRSRGLVLLACAAALALSVSKARAWGENSHKLVVNQAIGTLPPDIRFFFELNRTVLAQHVSDPLDAFRKTPAERHNHFLYLDKYGRFPFDALPRNYKAAVTKYTKAKL